MVECYEHLTSCQETILVLENYIRDFKALLNWFRVDADHQCNKKTQPPGRPMSLAWEVRKCNPLPKVRGMTLTSPALSGKSSPSFSGKNSPCLTIVENRPYSRMNGQSDLRRKPDGGLNFSGSAPLQRSASDGKLNENWEDDGLHIKTIKANILSPSRGANSQEIEASQVSVTIDPNQSSQYCQTDLDEDHLTLAAYREKYNISFGTSSPQVAQELPKATTEEPNKAAAGPAILAKRSEPQRPLKTLQQQAINPPATSRVAAPLRKPLHSANKSQNAFQLKKSSTVVAQAVKPNPITTARRPISTRNPVPTKSRPPPADASCLSKFHPRSKTMIEIKRSNNSATPRFGSNKRISQEDVNSSTSTLKASNERIGSSRSSLKERVVHNRKSEPKTLPPSQSAQEANDGWLTVKSKRRAHWTNRFHQPTGYASLPTLALLDEQNEDPAETENNKNKANKPDSKKVEPKVAAKKDPVKAAFVTSKVNKTKTAVELNKPHNPVKTSSNKVNANKPNPKPISKQPSRLSGPLKIEPVVRQKSDLTGLKIKSLHREFMRIEKLNNGPRRAEKIPLESKVLEGAEEDDSNASKVDMKIQTGSFGIPNKTVNLSSSDEAELRDTEESDDDQKKLLEEQENLERQIRELENTEIDVDTETDETDYEVLVDNDEEFSECGGAESKPEPLDLDEDATLETKYHLLLSEMSMCERLQTLATLEAFVARHPGRAQELHQKLSSPSRRRSLHETLKKYQAKQARAEEKREVLKKEKAYKIQLLLTRVEDVKQAKQQLIDARRHKMEERLQRATENREQYLKDKIRKAHDEDEKLREIAFIKSLTEQNKRLDLLESTKEHEVRMHDLEQERQKRVEEKAAKEAAAERRRLELEQERKRRLEKISETRREREKRVGKIQEQKEFERQKLAREKARDREERLQALQAQQQATTEELQRKINQKIQDSTRRYEENIEHVRQRAQELGHPSRNLDEMSNHGGESVSDLSSTVSDALEPNKTSKKKLKKLKSKIQEK